MAKAWDTTCDHTRDNTFLRHSWLVLTSLCPFNVKVRSYLVHVPYTCVLLYVSYLKKKKIIKYLHSEPMLEAHVYNLAILHSCY